MQEIIEKLNEDGYPIKEFVADSELHRFPLDDKDNKRSGWYVGHRNFLQSTGAEYYLVLYGSWREGGKENRYCTLDGKLPISQSHAHKKQINEAKKKAEKARAEAQKQAAEEAAADFETLEKELPARGNPYLKRKGLLADANRLGVRFGGDRLYVPARDIDGNIVSVEEIFPDGFKLAAPGTTRRGAFHIIGDIEASRRVYFAEGFATAASIHLATGAATICCFGIGGLKLIPSVVKKRYPDKQYVVCGDRDKTGKEDSRLAAEAAAKSIAAAICFPQFSSTDGEPTDFNDLHVREGIEKVKEQLPVEQAALVPVKLTPRDITELPYPDEKDALRLGTIDNLKELLRRLGITIRYNGITKLKEILIPDFTATVDNKNVATRAYITSWSRKSRIPVTDIGGDLDAIADENLYNPVATWIESEKWDGHGRMEELAATLHPKNKKLATVLLRKWIISAVAAAYEPGGVKAHGILVLCGKQYIGKTEWFRRLCAPELRADGVILRPDDKDSVLQVISKWLIELGELDATFRKADIAQLKAFITKDQDIVRRPYAAEESHYARRTVFLASVNEEQFLNDPTGNRRFWTIETEKIDYDHSVNMQQVWAEALELYRSGEKWWLDAEEHRALNTENEKYTATDPLEEIVASKFDWSDSRRQYMTATDVCEEIGISRPTAKDTKAVARALRRLTGAEGKKNNGRLVYPVAPRRLKEPGLMAMSHRVDG